VFLFVKEVNTPCLVSFVYETQFVQFKESTPTNWHSWSGLLLICFDVNDISWRNLFDKPSVCPVVSLSHQ